MEPRRGRGIPRLARRAAEGGMARRRLRHRRVHHPHRQDPQTRARLGGRPRDGADRVRAPAAGGQARGLSRRRRAGVAVFRRDLRRGRLRAGDQLHPRPRARRRRDAPRRPTVRHGRRLCMGFRRRSQRQLAVQPRAQRSRHRSAAAARHAGVDARRPRRLVRGRGLRTTSPPARSTSPARFATSTPFGAPRRRSCTPWASWSRRCRRRIAPP